MACSLGGGAGGGDLAAIYEVETLQGVETTREQSVAAHLSGEKSTVDVIDSTSVDATSVLPTRWQSVQIARTDCTMLIKDACKGVPSFLWAMLVLAMYFALATVWLVLEEDWDLTQAIYFGAATMSSVGCKPRSASETLH